MLYYLIWCGPYENIGKWCNMVVAIFLEVSNKSLKCHLKFGKSEIPIVSKIFEFIGILPNHPGYYHLMRTAMIPRIDLPMSQTIDSQTKLLKNKLFSFIIWSGLQRFGTLEGQSWVSWRYLSDGNTQNGWEGYQKFK